MPTAAPAMSQAVLPAPPAPQRPRPELAQLARSRALADEARIQTLVLGGGTAEASRHTNEAGNEVERRSWRAKSGDVFNMTQERAPSGELVRAEVSARRASLEQQPTPPGPVQAEKNLEQLLELRDRLITEGEARKAAILEALPAVISEHDVEVGAMEQAKLKEAGIDEVFVQWDEQGGSTMILRGPGEYIAEPLHPDAPDPVFEYRAQKDVVGVRYTRPDGRPGAFEFE